MTETSRKRMRLVSCAAVAMLAATVSLLAEVYVLPNGNIFVGRGDVLSKFNHDFPAQTFDSWGTGTTFRVSLSQAYEQACYFTGGQPSPETYAGVRTGTASVQGAAPALIYLNPNNVITGFELTPPSFDTDEVDIEWNGSGSGDPGGSGCPGGPSVSHPNGPPYAVGPVVIDTIWATISGIERVIFP